MIDINRHILYLLRDHDCVILPGFGGFILHQQDGRYDAGTRQFLPPSRQATFNGLLTEDDGLLISHIVEKEKITYRHGKELVGLYIDSLVREAGEKGRASFGGIGEFSLSAESKWVFNPSHEINFLDSAFGLRPVSAQFITPDRSVTRHRTPRERKDRKPISRPVAFPGPVKWTLAGAVPVILFLLWGILFPASFQEKYASYSGLLTDLFAEKAVLVEQPATSHDNTVAAPLQEVTETATDETLAMDVPATSEKEVEKTIEEEPIGIEPGDETTGQRVMYYVIGGVFQSEENANRYVKALSDLGYNSSLAGTNSRGYHRVSYDSFGNWSQAVKFLNEIKASENPSAWILKY